MPRRCTVCDHTERDAIDAAMVADESYRKIAERFGVSPSAVYRHRLHVPVALAQAQEAMEVTRADVLLGKIAALEADAKRLRAKAEQAGEYRTAIAAVRELVRIVELLAKLQGELQEGTTVNVVLSPQWVTIRAVIVAALEAYPEARARVVEALQDVGA